MGEVPPRAPRCPDEGVGSTAHAGSCSTLSHRGPSRRRGHCLCSTEEAWHILATPRDSRTRAPTAVAGASLPDFEPLA